MVTNGMPAGKVLAALLAGVGVCVVSALVFAFIGNPFGGDDTAAPPPTRTASASGISAPSARADQTEAFRAFATFDTVTTPGWLDLVTRVYRTDSGQLWALTSLPAGGAGRDRDIQAICGRLSSFVLSTGTRVWSAVSVRASDGSELLTRAEREGRCVP